jgi:hypothetical protein
VEERKHAIQEDQFEEEQRKKEQQCKKKLCLEEERCEEVERKEEVHPAQVQPQGFEVSRAGNESDEGREAEVRGQRQEGDEPEAGHRDRIVRSPKEGSESAPSEEEILEIVSRS